MPTQQDYYQLLGLSKDASTDDIKKAYRKLAHKYHPDKGGTKEDEEKFREVNQAYQVLSDPQKRQAYDQFGTAGVGGGPQGQGGPGYEGFQGFGGGFGFENFGDIFDQFFSGGAGTTSRGPSRGADMEMRATISFDEAVSGVSKEVAVRRRVACATCHGNGAEPGTKIVECDRCNGAGEIRTQRQTVLGTMTQVTACPVCKGEGKKPEKPCHTCGGEGRVQQEDTIKLEIPAGIDDGQTVRIQGAGEAGERGAPSGHLYVTVSVQPSKIFKRQGPDVLLEMPITFPQAALGDTIEVPTTTGRAKLDIPSGTESGRTFRIKGEGMPRLGGNGKGDQLVTVIVEVPKKLTSEEKTAIEQLAKAQGNSPSGKKSFFDKLGL